MNYRVLALVVGLSLAFQLGCEKKRSGFGLEGSQIRYETKKFDDPAILAEVNGQKITSEQILDKSPVIKDLAAQKNSAYIGMAYLKVLERNPDATGTVTVYLPNPEQSLDQILQRFGAQPKQGLALAYDKSEDKNLIATNGAAKITFDDIDKNHVVLQTIERREYQETASQLNAQISRILVNEEAQKQKMNLQDFIQKEIFKGDAAKVSDQELRDYAKSIGLAESELNSDLKPRLQAGLQAQKEQRLIEDYAAKNLIKGPMLVSFTAPRTNLRLSEDWKPVMGYADAPVGVVAFSSITCADCGGFIQTVLDLMKKHDGHLKLNWIHNFSENDGVARMVAEADLCIGAQKVTKSMEFAAEFTKSGATIDEANFYTWVKKNGLDEAAFK